MNSELQIQRQRGRPVVATSPPAGAVYVNRRGKTGLIVLPRNPVAPAGAVMPVLDGLAVRERLGGTDRARVAGEFIPEAHAARVKVVRQEVLAE